MHFSKFRILCITLYIYNVQLIILFYYLCLEYNTYFIISKLWNIYLFVFMKLHKNFCHV